MSLQRAGTGDDFEVTHWQQLVRRRWQVIAVLGLLGAALAAGAVLRPAARYQATTTVAVQTPLEQTGGTALTTDQVQAEVDLASTAVVKNGVPGTRDGTVTLSATTSAASGILNLLATAPTAAGAARAANAYAASYQKVKSTSLLAQYDAGIASLQAALTNLQSQRASATTDAARASLDGRIKALSATLQDYQVRRELAPSELPQVVSPANPPGKPVPRKLVTYVLIGAIAGLVVGLALAAALEHGDDAIRDADDLVAAYRRSGLTLDVTPPLVVVLPALDGTVSGKGRRRVLGRRVRSLPLAPSGSAAANWYAMLRASLDTRLNDGERGVLMVTSAVGEDGACTVAAHVAAAFARARGAAALIGLDTEDRVLAAAGLPPHRSDGLAVRHLLTGEVGLSDALVASPRQPGLLVASTGGQSLPVDLLGSDAGVAMLEQLRAAVGVTVLAAPGLTSHPEGTVVATLADCVVLVAQSGVTRHREVRAAVDSLFQVGASVCALVLTDVDGLGSPRQQRSLAAETRSARSQVL